MGPLMIGKFHINSTLIYLPYYLSGKVVSILSTKDEPLYVTRIGVGDFPSV